MNEMYDICIIGCGPAGLSAAINAKIRNKSTLVLGGEFCSIKLHKAPTVDNYLGFYNISGEDLRQKYIEHAKNMGVEVHNKLVSNIYPMGETFGIQAKNDMFQCKALILALGTQEAKSLEGEKELLGSGVSYCATCDGPLYKDKTVALVSYTSEGVEEAKYLSELVETLYYIPIQKECKIPNLPNMKIINQKPKSITGTNKVETLEFEDMSIPVDGVFLIKNSLPPDTLLPSLELINNAIKVDRQMATNIKGVFAAGDVTGRPWQLAKAVGEGQIAALSAVKYLDTKEEA